MRELFMTELPLGALTLRPADKVDRAMAMVAFPMWEDEKDGRFVVLVTSPEGEVRTDVELDDHWRAYRTFEGLAVELRRADCGAGCRCAGEFRFC
jgi:hypothetical protein